MQLQLFKEHPQKNQFVKVKAEFDIDGSVRPLAVIWKNGMENKIEKIFEERMVASLDLERNCTRYVVRVMGRDMMLWRDKFRWFIKAGR